ncbi:hypothetical protein GCM10009798_00190 [Nocardioides panacihumi]|uniref:Predicted membrane protein YciQ-like C-terminal domain-containing protein n=1 Tax=Nocardioides panacihumi TaxID=400774 RepID=A0ABN2Q6F8_9ACTN
MKRIAAYVAGIAAIAGLLCLPAIWSGDASSGARPDLPWKARWDAVLGTRPLVLVVVVLAGLVAAVVAGRIGAESGERAPSYARRDAPPDGIGPAQAVHVLGERVTTRTYVGTLLHAAHLGAVSLRRDDAGWVLTRGHDAPVDEVTRLAYEPLLEAGPFHASRTSAEAGAALDGAIQRVRSETRAWGVRSGTMGRLGLTGGCGVLLVVGIALVGACVVLQPFGMSMLGLLPGALVVGAVSAARAGAGTRHTRRGRELWSRVGGFRQTLTTPSSRHRFGFSGREELYTAYVPWAVAFGCTRQWAQKYRSEVGVEPPVPPFLGAYSGEHTGDHVDAVVHSLSSTVTDAIATAAAGRGSSGGAGATAGRWD